MMGLSFLASLRDTLSSASSWEAVEGALYCLLAVRNVVRTRLGSSDPTVSHQTHEVRGPLLPTPQQVLLVPAACAVQGVVWCRAVTALPGGWCRSCFWMHQGSPHVMSYIACSLDSYTPPVPLSLHSFGTCRSCWPSLATW
jgi:hypothetical protein